MEIKSKAEILKEGEILIDFFNLKNGPDENDFSTANEMFKKIKEYCDSGLIE